MTVEIQRLTRRIEGITDAFQRAVFVERDLDAALALVAEDGELRNLPTGSGARGLDTLRDHLRADVLPHLPTDLTFRRLSRTADLRRVVDETMVGFTHDRALPWLLPGVGPTGRRAEVLAISVVSFRHASRLGAVSSWLVGHRTLWDHHGLLAQLAPHPAAERSGGG